MFKDNIIGKIDNIYLIKLATQRNSFLIKNHFNVIITFSAIYKAEN